MLWDKQGMLNIINNELLDRQQSLQEGADHLKVEIEGLRELHSKVEAEQSLEFKDYLWLVDLCTTARERELDL